MNDNFEVLINQFKPIINDYQKNVWKTLMFL